MKQFKTTLLRIIANLYPEEMLGLGFLLVMVSIYLWLDLPMVPVGRFAFWGLIILFVLVISTCIRLFWNREDPMTIFDKREIIRFARSWGPLILFIIVYDNLHDVVRHVNPYNFDAFFIAVDKVLFFGNHPTLIFEQFISPYLTGWMSMNYALYFLYFPVTLGILYHMKKEREFHVTSFSLLLTIYSGFILYLLFPCVGPILAQHNLHTVDIYGGDTFENFDKILGLYGVYRDYFHCFPSLHFGVTTVFWVFSWRYIRPLFYIYTPFVLSLWFSTMYLRWHYVVDIIAGGIIAGYAIFFGPRIYRAWEKWRKKYTHSATTKTSANSSANSKKKK